MCPFRTETDSLGTLEIPNLFYYGIQTARAHEIFRISENKWPDEFIKNFASVKKACAMANVLLETLDPEKGRAIITACEELTAGLNSAQIVVDIFSGGSGALLNANINEIIANRAIEILGGKKGQYDLISPINHVNMSQSEADVLPTAVRLSLLTLTQKLIAALNELKTAFLKKSIEFDFIIKPSKADFSESVPMTLGQEFIAFAEIIKKSVEDIEYSKKRIKILNIGASEIGTGAGNSEKFHEVAIGYIKDITKLECEKCENLVEVSNFAYDFADYAAQLKKIAGHLLRISSELAELAADDSAGLKAINIPLIIKGAEANPAKTPPYALEVLMAAAIHSMGLLSSVETASLISPPNLNIYNSIIAVELFTSLKILTNAVNLANLKCVTGITANEKSLFDKFKKSNAIAGIVMKKIGYEKTAELLNECKVLKKSMFEMVLEKSLLNEAELEILSDPRKISEPLKLF